MIYLVMGLGRCGTSMIMQMFKAGGIECGAAPHPYYEDDRATKILPEQYRWLSEYDGKVLKVLKPDTYITEAMFDDLGLKPKGVWIERADTWEQAKSWRKFLSRRGYEQEVAKTTDESVRQTIKAQFGRAKSHAFDIDPHGIDVVFEDILEDPLSFAHELKDWVGVDFDAEAAAAVVHPREKNCLPYMLEDEL